jgi:hypothetical protein
VVVIRIEAEKQQAVIVRPSDIPKPNSDKHNNPLTRQSVNEQTAGIFI